MRNHIIGLAHGDIMQGVLSNTWWATAATDADFGLGAVGVETCPVRDQLDDPGYHGLRMDIRTGYLSAILIANAYTEEDGSVVVLAGDEQLKSIARVAAEEVVPIFIAAEETAEGLGLEMLKSEIIVIGSDFGIIKRMLGEQ